MEDCTGEGKRKEIDGRRDMKCGVCREREREKKIDQT